MWDYLTTEQIENFVSLNENTSDNREDNIEKAQNILDRIIDYGNSENYEYFTPIVWDLYQAYHKEVPILGKDEITSLNRIRNFKVNIEQDILIKSVNKTIDVLFKLKYEGVVKTCEITDLDYHKQYSFWYSYIIYNYSTESDSSSLQDIISEVKELEKTRIDIPIEDQIMSIITSSDHEKILRLVEAMNNRPRDPIFGSQFHPALTSSTMDLKTTIWLLKNNIYDTNNVSRILINIMEQDDGGYNYFASAITNIPDVHLIPHIKEVVDYILLTDCNKCLYIIYKIRRSIMYTSSNMIRKENLYTYILNRTSKHNKIVHQILQT